MHALHVEHVTRCCTVRRLTNERYAIARASRSAALYRRTSIPALIVFVAVD